MGCECECLKNCYGNKNDNNGNFYENDDGIKKNNNNINGDENDDETKTNANINENENEQYKEGKLIFYQKNDNVIENEKEEILFDNFYDAMKKKTSNNESKNSISSSIESQKSSSEANTNIYIEYKNEKYPFKIKDKYDLSKILYRFKKQNKQLKPEGKFSYKGDDFISLSKTCEDLGIKEGAILKLI